LSLGEKREFVQDNLGHKNVQNIQISSKISDKRRRKQKGIFHQLECSPEIVRF
jgi:hypothetical protein